MNNTHALHLKGLQYQLSEHFIFNVMNTLRVLIRKDPPQATEMLNTFSEYLRFALHKTQAFETTLEKETEGISLFMRLQEIRFKKTIVLVKDIPPALLHTAVPGFILQPFTELLLKKSSPEEDGITRLHMGVSQQNTQLTISFAATSTPCNPAVTDSFFSPKSDAELGCEQAIALCRACYGEQFEAYVTHEQNRYTHYLKIPA